MNVINDIQIGGRNYYKKSTTITNNGTPTVNRNHASCPNGLYLIGAQGDNSWIRLNNVIDSNGYWTISFDLRGSQSLAQRYLRINICGLGNKNINSTADNEWRHHEFTVNVTNYSSTNNYIDFEYLAWAYIFIKDLKIEKGTKATDWTPAPEDVQSGIDNAQNTANNKATLAEVASSLSITNNKITLSSKTIELNGTTIAKAIEVEDLKVGNRSGAAALEVLKSGEFYAKGSSSGGSLEIDSQNRFIEIKSNVQKYTEHNGLVTDTQTARIDSTMGEFRVKSGSDTAYVSSQGVFLNRAGINTPRQESMYPGVYGPYMKASIVAIGTGEMDSNSWGSSWGGIVGVYGEATNNSQNPSPAYGGYFNILKAVGLYLNVRRISSGTTLNKYDVFVSCNNTSTITVYLPSSPYEGQIIIVRRNNAASITVSGNGISITYKGSAVSTVIVGYGAGDIGLFVYDGQYWSYNYFGS